MKSFIAKLHTRLGDFWWYSILMFVALRFGDVINAIVGLWLVPKFVNPDELGAVLPLTQFASFLALPLSLLITVFSKFLNKYNTLREFGKVKSLLRYFLFLTIISILASILLSTWLTPHLFNRINIAKGSLGILIIACGLVNTSAPLFTSALQGLKKFKTLTLINLISAPIRLFTMLIFMPIRALSGYLLGQIAAPAFTIATSCLSLRQEISSHVQSVSFLKDDWKPILRYFIWIAISVIPGQLAGFVQTLIIRQRLPAVESAAFYMISRFSELATYAGVTLLFVMFPIAAEAHTKGRENKKVLFQMNVGTIVFGLLCTTILWIFGSDILSVLPSTKPYCAYSSEMVLLSAAMLLQFLWGNYSSYETANNRFTYIYYSIPINIIYAAVLICFTGANFFIGILSPNTIHWMQSFNVANLRNILLLLLAANAIKLFLATIECMLHSRNHATST